MAKIGANDPCWCGSREKYKRCHLNRESEPRLPFTAIANHVIEDARLRQCLHPEASPGICDKIVSAHTIQRSRVLDRIVNSENHVCTFFSPHTDFSLEGPKVLRVGWREASTFTGFCSKHDSATFRALETRKFDGSFEQCFLIGYRALCHEIHQKSRMLKSHRTFLRLVDRGLPIEGQVEMQQMGLAQEAGFRKGLEDFGRLKSIMDDQLIKGSYQGWSRVVIDFKGPLCIASTGAVSPNRDLFGIQLQTLDDPNAQVQELLFGIVATARGGAAVFLCRADEEIPQTFVQSILRQDQKRIGSLIAQFVFVYIENTYFSREWWTSLSDINRKQMTSLAWTSNAYEERFHYSPSSKIVPWEIVNVDINED
jgi:hypothetical protein